MRSVFINSPADIKKLGLSMQYLYDVYKNYISALRPYSKMIQDEKFDPDQIAHEEIDTAISASHEKLVLF